MRFWVRVPYLNVAQTSKMCSMEILSCCTAGASLRNSWLGWGWWLIPVILALGRQEEYCKFKANLRCTERSWRWWEMWGFIIKSRKKKYCEQSTWNTFFFNQKRGCWKHKETHCKRKWKNCTFTDTVHMCLENMCKWKNVSSPSQRKSNDIQNENMVPVHSPW